MLFRTLRTDVTLMDLRLPGMTGAETIHSIRPSSRTRLRDAVDVCLRSGDLRRVAGGRDGLLVKSVQREELMTAIRKAAAGHRYIPSNSRRGSPYRVAATQLSYGKPRCSG